MLCSNPFMQGVMPCPCGRCDSCLSKRKGQWRDRILIEQQSHGDSCFVTLTYDDDHLPKGASLSIKDYQDWLKRLRLAVAPRCVRYYIAGEYGGQTWRPHYHAILFGVSAQEEALLKSTWAKGNIVVGTLTPQSAAYVAGYVMKKMGKKGDVALNGREPEFQRMSLRPGLGGLGVRSIGQVLSTKSGARFVADMGDVPYALEQSGKTIHLGRYLRGKLREYMGFSDKKTPVEQIKKYALSMRVLCEDYVENKKGPSQGPKKIVLDIFSQKRLNLLAKNKIYTGAKPL